VVSELGSYFGFSLPFEHLLPQEETLRQQPFTKYPAILAHIIRSVSLAFFLIVQDHEVRLSEFNRIAPDVVISFIPESIRAHDPRERV
jgi:hypothetical protein